MSFFFQNRPASCYIMHSFNNTAPSRPMCPYGIIGRPSQDIDKKDLHYPRDLYVFYKHQENVRRPVDYMALRPEINADLRASLVELLTVAHQKLNLQPETLYLAVYIVDRFLSFHVVARSKLHIIGISSLHLAAKYEEECVPKAAEFLNSSRGNHYTGLELCFWEKLILEKLDWYLTVPTVFMFLVRFIEASKADKELENMIYFFGELGLKDYKLILYKPSMVAASSVYAARCALRRLPRWPDTLQQYTSYSESHLLNCARILAQAHFAAVLGGKTKMHMVYKKYWHM